MGGEGGEVVIVYNVFTKYFSTFVDAVMRKKMGDQAIQLAHAVGYDSAGMIKIAVSFCSVYYIRMVSQPVG